MKNLPTLLKPLKLISKIFLTPHMFSLLICCLFLFTCKAQNISNEQSTPPHQNSTTSPYPVTVNQKDNTTIQVIGKGNRKNPYAETIDGFTISKNENKIYEYMLIGSNGSLELSGVKANDPDKRTPKEKEFIKHLEKHIRNQ